MQRALAKDTRVRRAARRRSAGLYYSSPRAGLRRSQSTRCAHSQKRRAPLSTQPLPPARPHRKRSPVSWSPISVFVFAYFDLRTKIERFGHERFVLNVQVVLYCSFMRSVRNWVLLIYKHMISVFRFSVERNGRSRRASNRWTQHSSARNRWARIQSRCSKLIA